MGNLDSTGNGKDGLDIGVVGMHFDELTKSDVREYTDFTGLNQINEDGEIRVTEMIDNLEEHLINLVMRKKGTTSKVANIMGDNNNLLDGTLEHIKSTCNLLRLRGKGIELMFNEPICDDAESHNLPIIVVYNNDRLELANYNYLNNTGIENPKQLKKIASQNIETPEGTEKNALVEKVYFGRNRQKVYNKVAGLGVRAGYRNTNFTMGRLENIKHIAWNSFGLLVNDGDDKVGSVRVGMNVTDEIENYIYGEIKKEYSNFLKDIVKKATTNKKHEEIDNTEREILINRLEDTVKKYYKFIQAIEYNDFLVDEVSEVLFDDIQQISYKDGFLKFLDKYEIFSQNKMIQELKKEVILKGANFFADEKFTNKLQLLVTQELNEFNDDKLIQTFRVQLGFREDLKNEEIQNKLVYILSRLKKFQQFNEDAKEIGGLVKFFRIQLESHTDLKNEDTQNELTYMLYKLKKFEEFNEDTKEIVSLIKSFRIQLESHADLKNEDIQSELFYKLSRLKKFEEFSEDAKESNSIISLQQKGDLFFDEIDEKIQDYLEDNYGKKRLDGIPFGFCRDVNKLIKSIEIETGEKDLKSKDEFGELYKNLMIIGTLGDTVCDKGPFTTTMWEGSTPLIISASYTGAIGYNVEELKNGINLFGTEEKRTVEARLNSLKTIPQYADTFFYKDKNGEHIYIAFLTTKIGETPDKKIITFRIGKTDPNYEKVLNSFGLIKD